MTLNVSFSAAAKVPTGAALVLQGAPQGTGSGEGTLGHRLERPPGALPGHHRALAKQERRRGYE